MLGTLGKRETENGLEDLTDHERPIVRRQAARVIAQSIAVALVATAVIWFV
jgi:hypothetical protein